MNQHYLIYLMYWYLRRQEIAKPIHKTHEASVLKHWIGEDNDCNYLYFRRWRTRGRALAERWSRRPQRPDSCRWLSYTILSSKVVEGTVEVKIQFMHMN